MTGLVGWDATWDGTIAQVEAAAAAFCAQPWSAVASPYASSYCFSGAYIPSLLAAYGFSAASRAVTYARTLGGVGVEWTLGAQIFYLQQARAQPGPPAAARCVSVAELAGEHDLLRTPFRAGLRVLISHRWHCVADRPDCRGGH